MYEVPVQASRLALYDKKVAPLRPRGDVAQSLRTEGKMQMPRFQENKGLPTFYGTLRVTQQ
jgi:hypothetical protein